MLLTFCLPNSNFLIFIFARTRTHARIAIVHYFPFKYSHLLGPTQMMLVYYIADYGAWTGSVAPKLLKLKLERWYLVSSALWLSWVICGATLVALRLKELSKIASEMKRLHHREVWHLSQSIYYRKYVGSSSFEPMFFFFFLHEC
jgi:hypothetical protein